MLPTLGILETLKKLFKTSLQDAKRCWRPAAKLFDRAGNQRHNSQPLGESPDLNL